MKPSVGRVVHYVARGSADGHFPSVCRAAIVADVDPGVLIDGAARVTLAVLNPSGLFFDKGVHQHQGDPNRVGPLQGGYSGCEHGERAYPGGTWHWPEQVR